MNHHPYLARIFHQNKDFAAPARRALAAFAHPCASSANVCFYDSGNNATHGDKTSPGKRFDCSTNFAFFGP